MLRGQVGRQDQQAQQDLLDLQVRPAPLVLAAPKGLPARLALLVPQALLDLQAHQGQQGHQAHLDQAALVDLVDPREPPEPLALQAQPGHPAPVGPREPLALLVHPDLLV